MPTPGQVLRPGESSTESEFWAPTKSRGDVSPGESPKTESEDREKENGSPAGKSSNALSLASSVTSLVAQTVKRLPTMRETRVRSWVGKIP